MFAQVSDSKLADNAPELVVVLLIIGAIIAGMWRVIGKLQDGQHKVIEDVQVGQEKMVNKFLTHIRESEERQEVIAEAHRDALDRLQDCLNKNTLMLGKTGSALERATYLMGQMERQNHKPVRDDE